MSEGIDHPVKAYLLALYMDLLIIMTKYTLILAPLEVFAKRTFLGQGPETAALPDPEQMENKIKASSVKLQASSSKLRRRCTCTCKNAYA